jgi:hypothetical protein
MDLFFNVEVRKRNVHVVPWMTFADKYYFVVASHTNPSQTKYAAFEMGSTAEEITLNLTTLFPKMTSLERVYAAPVLETETDVIVWVHLDYVLTLPEGTRKVTFKNFKALAKASLPGMDPLLKAMLTRSAPRDAHTRLGGVRKGLQTLTRVL